MDAERGHETVRRSQALAVEATTARRRGNGIFCSASVAHVDDDEDDVFGGVNVVSAKVCCGEKLLLNGDYYAGDWLGRLPHGHGKYLWSDGCMYDGEWCKGRTMGKGRFCWPSGATYEGQFNDGFMDGVGIYTAPSGDTYKGSWSRNMKHGHGTKTFVEGDAYEGEWKHGAWHGHGRYRWKNGHCYIGQWKNGVINGKGAMIWSNGNRYEGLWEAGLPKGMGTFRLADGSCYDRSNEDGEQRWPYRDSVSQNGNRVGEDRRGTLKGNDDFVRPRKTSMDCHSHVGMPGGCRLLRIGRVSRQGEMISKGHKNYELMLNLQLGIRHSVSRPTPVNSLDPIPSAFDTKHKMQTRFPPEGSKNTPPHQSCEFRWKDYCPVVFRALRKLFEIDAAKYMISLCGDDALREISSPGKSGSFFYLTNDDRYMIKTIKKAEVKALLRMLPAYCKHVQKYQNTLLTKFLGLHCVKLTGATRKKVRFVVMGNLFCSRNTVHRCFDLKGSSQGRVAEKPENDIHTTTPLKDLDLNFVFRLQKPTFQEFRRQVNIDCDFLKRERIMDYSLLIGLHFQNTTCERDVVLARPINSQENTVRDGYFSSPAHDSKSLGFDMLARAELTGRPDDGLLPTGGPIEEIYNVSISLGIIDILQDYDITKKLEHAYKSMQYDAALISAVDPRQYSRRFCDFIFKAFAEDT